MRRNVHRGGTFVEVVQKLYAEGGIPRFYRGLAPGLIQADGLKLQVGLGGEGFNQRFGEFFNVVS